MVETKMYAIRIDLVSEDKSLTSGRILCDCAASSTVHFFFSHPPIDPLRSLLSERSVES
jgi:hypothetical protein